MTKDEELAMDLALEALEYIHEGANNQGPHTGISWRCVAVKAEPAIKAIKQARALDKMAENARELGLDYEPAEWLTGCPECGMDSGCDCDSGTRNPPAAPVQEDWGPGPHECHSLTAAPVQEPLTDDHIERIYHRYGGDMINCARAIERASQRQWVGLTDDEVSSLMRKFPDHLTWDITRAIEAKLKEKNT